MKKLLWSTLLLSAVTLFLVYPRTKRDDSPPPKPAEMTSRTPRANAQKDVKARTNDDTQARLDAVRRDVIRRNSARLKEIAPDKPEGTPRPETALAKDLRSPQTRKLPPFNRTDPNKEAVEAAYFELRRKMEERSRARYDSKGRDRQFVMQEKAQLEERYRQGTLTSPATPVRQAPRTAKPVSSAYGSDHKKFQRWSQSWTDEDVARLYDKYSRSIDTAARTHGVDPKVVVSVIGIESSGKNMIGEAGEVGPMQILPSTGAKYVPPSQLRIPHYNIMAGTNYLKDLKERYNDDLAKMIFAYNRGSAPSTVNPQSDYHLRKFFHLYNLQSADKPFY